MIRRSTIVVVFFGVIVAAIVGYNQLVKSQPPLEITVAVDPLAEDWIRKAAEDFNATGTLVNNGTTRVHINVEAAKDIDVWTGKVSWNFEKHPLAWIPASSASVQYVPTNLPFKTLQPSLARTPLVWGGFQSRVNAITKDGQQPFDWLAVNEVLKAGRWEGVSGSGLQGNINMAINPPRNSTAGLAALIIGLADLNDTDTVSRSHLSGAAYDEWVEPLSIAVPNIAGSPAVEMASRGTSVADFALLTESQWLVSLSALNRRETVALSYPAHQFILDFPLALWDDASTTDIQRQAATAFGTYLAGTVGQQLPVTFGLRPAKTDPTTADALFADAIPYGIQFTPDFGVLVNIPGRNESETLLRALD